MSGRTCILLCLAILTVTVAGCGQQGNDLVLEGTSWILVDMAGEAPQPGSGITIAFEDGQVRGHMSCNSFSGSYTLSGNALAFGMLMTTLMACVDDALMDQEHRMFELIGLVEEARLIDGRLHLVLADGNRLIYEPME